MVLLRPLASYLSTTSKRIRTDRLRPPLTSEKITELLTRNEFSIQSDSGSLPSYVRSIECSQLGANYPSIEDSLRVSLLHLPGFREPSLIVGVFDGHGGYGKTGETTVDLISRRLFDYIALSLHPDPQTIDLSQNLGLKSILTDLYHSPEPRTPEYAVQETEQKSLLRFKDQISLKKKKKQINIPAKLRASFTSCDEDLSNEIQCNLTNKSSSENTLSYYSSAALSGCCALVMVIHDGVGYLASSGDSRAVLGTLAKTKTTNRLKTDSTASKNSIEAVNLKKDYRFEAVQLNHEHNSDNLSERKRLKKAHPREPHSLIMNKRLLGDLIPFRAFGDFIYKWAHETMRACDVSGFVSERYNNPPYLIAEPEITELPLTLGSPKDVNDDKYVVMASDGLWEKFESSRDVIETLVDYTQNSTRNGEKVNDYDSNAAVHLLRTALRRSSEDGNLDVEELKRLHHLRLEETLTEHPVTARFLRDDISIVLLKVR